MQVTLEAPKAFNLIAEDNVQPQNMQLQETVPHCVAAAGLDAACQACES